MKPRHKKNKKQKKNLKNYAEKYKVSLLKFVQNNNSNNTTLSELIEKKLNELFSSDQTTENENYIVILSLSLYFIKDNNFIEDDYFNQIDDKIYKYFNDFIINPTEEQHKKFLESFENLNYGFNNIFLICRKLYGKETLFRDKALDLFFKIIITEHFNEVKENFSFPTTNDQKSLIIKLTKFIKIQYNYKEVTKEEVFDLFRETVNNNSIDEGENKIQEKQSSVESKKEGSEKDLENMQDTISETLGEKDNSLKGNIIPNQINNKIITNNIGYNFFTYLDKIQQEYQKKNYLTPVLDYVLKNKIKLKTKYFRKKKDENSFIDHLYDYLETLLFSLNTSSINLGDNKVGYICYFDYINKKYFEGIYSNIDIRFLFEKVVSDKNFPPDDIYNPDEIIAHNAFKSRALSFEFYINNEIILNKLKAKERPRVIYIFRTLEDIKKLIEEEDFEEKDDNIESFFIEVDGVILEKKDNYLVLDRNFFIADPVNKFDYFNPISAKPNDPSMSEIVNYHYKKDVINEKNIKDINNDNKDDENLFYLDKNSLCVIEIKNQFPINSGILNKENLPDFYNTIKKLIKKALIFKEMFEQLNEKVESIKLMLFYDAIHKINYEKELCKVIRDLVTEDNKIIISTIEFQCVYIKSSYLAGGVSSYQREINIMKYEIKKLNDLIKTLRDEKMQKRSKNIISINEAIELKGSGNQINLDIKSRDNDNSNHSKSEGQTTEKNKKDGADDKK